MPTALRQHPRQWLVRLAAWEFDGAELVGALAVPHRALGIWRLLVLTGVAGPRSLAANGWAGLGRGQDSAGGVRWTGKKWHVIMGISLT